MITPSLGLTVYTVKAIVGKDAGVGEVFAGIVPFLLGLLFTLSLFVLVPQVVLWLPELQTYRWASDVNLGGTRLSIKIRNTRMPANAGLIRAVLKPGKEWKL